MSEASQKFNEVIRLRQMADTLRGDQGLGQEEYQKYQNELGVHDRSSYAESVVEENPLMAIPLTYGVPLEHIAKKLGIRSGRSEPSLDSLAGGYRGIGRGLKNALAAALRNDPQAPDASAPKTETEIAEYKRQMLERSYQLDDRPTTPEGKLDKFRQDVSALEY